MDSDDQPGLRRLVSLARNDNAGGYRDQLMATAPALGLRLPGLARPIGTALATRLLGHPPGPADVDRLDRVCRPRVESLLPHLPGEVPERLVRQLCRQPTRTDTPPHPVDVASTWPVLLAALLAELGESELPADLIRPRHGEDPQPGGVRQPGADRQPGDPSAA